ncbi:hypothetical protein D3C76_1117660 [compost metagenome]
MFCARRMRATICPIRPMPAITTRGSSASISRNCSGTATGCTFGLTSRAHSSSNNGVSAIDRVIANTSRSYRRGSNKPWSRPILNTTKANSPPAASTMPRRMALILFKPPATLPTINSNGSLTAISSTVSPSTTMGSRSSRLRLAPMPTLMKNSPSSRPLKGSICASSSWRYSESASSRPARKAPRAMEIPARSISQAVPITTSNAVAVDTSGKPVLATTRNTGRSK